LAARLPGPDRPGHVELPRVRGGYTDVLDALVLGPPAGWRPLPAGRVPLRADDVSGRACARDHSRVRSAARRGGGYARRLSRPACR
jgi:hypothetical protein